MNMPQRNPLSGRAVNPKTKKPKWRHNKKHPHPETLPIRHKAYGLIFSGDNKRILVGESQVPLRNLFNRWVLPGGHVEHHELQNAAHPYTEALIREVREEAQFEIKLLDEHPLLEMDYLTTQGPVHAKLFAAKGSIPQTYPRDSDEVRGWALRTIPELIEDPKTSWGVQQTLLQLQEKYN